MLWRETHAVDERMRFVLAAEAGEEAFAALCRQFGISRTHGYKWLARWRAGGAAALVDRSRAPRTHPQAVAAALAEACLDVRRAHPTWGPVKVRAWLERQRPGSAWPAASTIGALFDRAGLTVRRRPRRRGPPGGPLIAAAAANDVWTMDFKGWFRTGDGARCGPFTLCDAASRYPFNVRLVHSHPSTGLPAAQRVLDPSPRCSSGAEIEHSLARVGFRRWEPMRRG